MYINAVQYKLAQPSPALSTLFCIIKEQSCAVQCNTVHCTGAVQLSAAQLNSTYSSYSALLYSRNLVESNVHSYWVIYNHRHGCC